MSYEGVSWLYDYLMQISKWNSVTSLTVLLLPAFVELSNVAGEAEGTPTFTSMVNCSEEAPSWYPCIGMHGGNVHGMACMKRACMGWSKQLMHWCVEGNEKGHLAWGRSQH